MEQTIIQKIREERLNSKENHIYLVDSFSCGKAQIFSDYIQGEAFSHNRNGEGNSYLFFKDDTNIILGYYTLRASSINVDGYYWPVIEISRLAIQNEYQRLGIGRFAILVLINQKIINVSQQVGIKAVLVFADSDAIDFYKHIGFKPIGENTIRIIEDGYRDDCSAMIMKINEQFIEESNEAYLAALENNII